MPGERDSVEEISRLKNVSHCVEVYQLIASQRVKARAGRIEIFTLVFVSNVSLHRSSVDLIMRLVFMAIYTYCKNISFVILLRDE